MSCSALLSHDAEIATRLSTMCLTCRSSSFVTVTVALDSDSGTRTTYENAANPSAMIAAEERQPRSELRRETEPGVAHF